MTMVSVVKSGCPLQNNKVQLHTEQNGKDHGDVQDEVLLHKGDGLLDVGGLTRCKNAVCMILRSTDDCVK